MTGDAYRVRKDNVVLYLMPYEDTPGRRVVFEQHPHTFETERRTVGTQRARTLAESGRAVGLHETPAWADPRAPRDSTALAEP